MFSFESYDNHRDQHIPRKKESYYNLIFNLSASKNLTNVDCSLTALAWKALWF